jgi:phage-related tail protein
MLKLLTSEQFWSLIRTVLQSAGASLAVLGVAEPHTIETLIGMTATAQVLVGAGVNLVTTGYSLYIRRKAGLVASAAALPEVATIVTTPEIAAKVDDPRTVVAR